MAECALISVLFLVTGRPASVKGYNQEVEREDERQMICLATLSTRLGKGSNSSSLLNPCRATVYLISLV